MDLTFENKGTRLEGRRLVQWLYLSVGGIVCITKIWDVLMPISYFMA